MIDDAGHHHGVDSTGQEVEMVPSTRHLGQATALLRPVAAAVFVFTVSYPANDFITASKPSDIGLGMFLVYFAIAAVTVGLLFFVVLPRAFRRGGNGGLALALAILGTVFAPGFWTGVPPAFAASGALLGWAGTEADSGRTLSKAAFVVGLLGVGFNVVSYADVFI
jgi:hypothetical protein